jgi:hypothetical protein
VRSRVNRNSVSGASGSERRDKMQATDSANGA